MTHKLNALGGIAVLLAISSAAFAQVPADPTLVYVPAAVTGAKNAYVTGLQKENFKLLEDGKEQTVAAFLGEDRPIDINILLGLRALQSGRADLNSAKIREAVDGFRQKGNPQNKYTVEEMPFGANGIFDGISRHITGLHERSTNPRKLLLVITDGFENSGGEPGRALQEYAKKLSVPVYIVYAGSATGGNPADILEVARGQEIHLSGGAVYDDLARYTGGRLYQAEADTQLRASLESLAVELRNQYVLGFKSTNSARDDKWRKLEIKMTPPAGSKENLKPKVRDRYFVAKPQGSR
jgi:Ca-activated chloride channel family protein